jgi:glycosyltransferase involved in cell wall biosynthesis
MPRCFHVFCPSSMRIAIVHPWFVMSGGGERVIDVLAEIYPQADFFVLMKSDRHLSKAMQGRRIQSTFLDRIPGAKRYYQHVMPLYPFAAQSLDVSGYDLIISSGGPAAKGVIVDQNAVHIHYCHTPVRFLWDQYSAWRKRLPWLVRPFFALGASYLREWDFNSAQRVDAFIANSNYVAQRIQTYYRRTSTTIYPPVDVSRGYVEPNRENYYLSVGRLVHGKRTELLIEACNRLKKRLLIAGSGPEDHRLKAAAGPTVEFLGKVDDTRLSSLFAQAKAFLFAADDDFGIAPVEAQAFGLPVIAYGKGGVLETVIGDDSGLSPTGTFFYEQTADSLCKAILHFEENQGSFEPQHIRKHSESFSTEVFRRRMADFIQECYSNEIQKRQRKPNP